MTVRLTRREKDAIRSSPCGRCGAVPPFADGSRCHPHRVRPELGYVAGNVVPRCPPCHAAEPGHHPWIKAARKGGRRSYELHPENVRALNARLTPAQRSAIGRRVHELHPDLARENGRRSQALHPENVRALNAKLTPMQRSAIGRKGGLALNARLTPAERSARGRKASRAITSAQRSANARKGWAAHRARRVAA